MLLKDEFQFFICELTLVEIFNHKEKITKLSKLSENDISKFYYQLLRKINIFKEDLIKGSHWHKAFQLCRDIDESDTPFIALTLELDGLLFTGDKKLKSKLQEKGFNMFFDYSKKDKDL